MKIRSGAKLYTKIQAGDPKAKAALKTMIAKANKGDQQAKRDVNAVYAGRVAVQAKKQAQKKQAAVLAGKARKLKVIAAQRKVEAGIANKLVRTERKMQLAHYAKVEAKAAKGNKKAVAYVAKQVAASKKGDKKATARVGAMKIGRQVRLAAPTKRERRNLAVAAKVVARARKNDPKALRQIAVHKAAAKQGNPNAKRAMKRYEVAAVVVTAVATGALAGSKVSKKTAKKRKSDQAAVLKAQKDLKAGTGTREEYAAGARAAQALGDKATAGTLAVAASNAPSATESLKKTATVVAAKEAGNEQAKSAIVKNFEEAKSGDPEAIKKTGNVVAVQTIDDINKGRPLSPAMTDAINLHERIAAGDKAAIEQSKAIMTAATQPNPIPEATAAAVTLAAAAVTANALASKPKAREEFLAKVNPPMSAAEKGSAEAEVGVILAKAKDGTVTADEGARGVRLAERLGKPGIAAQISSMAPPMEASTPLSTLPDMPLAPISGVWDLLKESIKAVTLSTRDPLGNYRGGVASRSKATTVAAEPVSSSGWSPFAMFKVAAPWIAPLASSAAAAASFTNLLTNKSKKSAPVAAAPVAAPAAAAPAAAPTEAPTKSDSAEAETVAPKVAKANPFEGKEQSAPKKNPHDSSSGSEKTFKDYITAAVKSKKMSKSDFNKAMDGHLGEKATKESKLASGEKVLKFLASKGVKVES